MGGEEERGKDGKKNKMEGERDGERGRGLAPTPRKKFWHRHCLWVWKLDLVNLNIKRWHSSYTTCCAITD